MAAETSPAFQFYPRDWLSDDKVALMSSAARGVYFELLCHCWLQGSIPTDPASLQTLGRWTPLSQSVIRIRSRRDSEWGVLWQQIVTCFTERDGRYYQKRAEAERAKQADFREKKRKAGLASGLARKHLPNPNGNTRSNVLPTKSNSSSSSSSSSSEDPLEIQIIRKGRAPSNSTNGAREADENSKLDSRPKAPPTVLAGSLPREHLSHALCDETHARCVPNAVHAKLINLLAPKHAGDREATSLALLAWYPTVWLSLPTNAVIGDAFRFWQPRFDQAFALDPQPLSKNNSRIFAALANIKAGGERG